MYDALAVGVGGLIRPVTAWPGRLRFWPLGRPMGLGGLEPPTSPLSGVRSNQLSYKPEYHTPEGANAAG